MPSEREQEIRDGVELLDQLLGAADGGHPVGQIGSYDASTIVALLANAKYRKAVLARLPDFDSIAKK